MVLHADDVDLAAGSSQEEQASFFKKFGGVFKKTMEAAATGGKGAEGVEKMIKLVTERGPQAIEFITDAVKQISNSGGSS